MKTVTIPPSSAEVNLLLRSAQEEDVLVRAADGKEYLLSAVDDFDYEIVLTRQNEELMALLSERSLQNKVVSLSELREQLGLTNSP